VERPNTAGDDPTGEVTRSLGNRCTQRKNGSQECGSDKINLIYLSAG